MEDYCYHKNLKRDHFWNQYKTSYKKHEESYYRGFEMGSLWFCGNEYPLIMYGNYDSSKYSGDSRFPYYDKDKDYGFLSPALDSEEEVNKFLNTDKGFSWLEDSHKNQRQDDFINISFESPAVFISNGYVIVNPCLKNIGFARIMPPHICFQEIQMYLMGTLLEANIKEPLPLTEKDQVRRHGMDKWSFRKMPTKK